MSFSRISVLTLIVCVSTLASALIGCADIAATNPFDPGSPSGQQAAGAVTGTLVRPLGHDASRFVNARVTLVALGGPPRPASDAGATAAAEAAADPLTGVFTVTDVVPGAYTVAFVVPGFRAPPMRVEVGIGETLSLGEVALEVPSRTTTITGVAHRAGAADDGHGGISVEALGTPFTTATTSEGAFALAVTEGEFTLRFSLPGYTAQSVPLGRTLAAGDTFALPAEVLLVGAPGSVRGSLTLQPGFTGDLTLPDAQVTLVPADGMAGPPTQPDVQGRFAFADVVAADYTLHVELGGFFPLDVPLTVAVGAALELPSLTLFAVSDGTGEHTGFVVGTAALQGAAEGRHGGTRVEAVGTPFVALTADDGAFRLPVAAGRRYDIALSHEGYTAHVAPDVLIEAGVETPLEKVTLVGEPGRVTGVVQLPERFRDRLQGVDVCLLLPDAPTGDCAGAEGGVDAPFAHANPAADGRFLFDAVGAGNYALVAVLDGFEPWRDELEVTLGAETRGGRIVLVPAEPRAAMFGLARPAGAGDTGNAGTNVSAVGTPYGTQTNDDGTYLLDLPARAAGYTLRFGRPGYNEETRAVDALPEGALVELAEVVLSGQPGRISGTVVLPAPDPAALDSATAQRFAAPGPDALACADDPACPAPARCVLLTCRTPQDDANVDAAGHFVFADVPAGAHTVGIRLDRFHPAAVDTVVRVGAETVVGNIGLTPLPAQAFVTGMAQRVGAATHGGITITLRGTAFQAETTPEGRFLLAVPVSDLGYTLDATMPGYGSESVQIGGLSPGETHALPDPILLIGQPGRIRLLVELPEEFVDPDLILQASVEVSRFDEANALVLVRSEPVSPNGVVVLDALAAGGYVLRITHPGFDTSFRSVNLDVGAHADLGVVRLALPGDALRALVRGTVRLRCGGPCSYGGIRVEAAGVPFVTFTNAEGRFELLVTDGSYTLLATYPGFQQTGPPRIIVVSEGQAVALDPDIELAAAPGSVTGRLVLPAAFDARALLPSAMVTLDPGDSAVAPLSNGLFTLDAIEPGDYDLNIALAGFAPLRLPITIGPGRALDLGIVALATLGGERITGSVHLADVDDPLGHRGVRVEVLNTPYETLTSDTGAFDVAGIPGDLTLRLSRADYRVQLVAVEDVLAGEARRVPGTLQLEVSPAGVSGRVLRLDADRIAQPAAGSTITLYDAADRVADTAPAGADGRFRFTDRRPGEYRLEVTRPLHDTEARGVQLRADEVYPAGDLVLDLQRGSAAGRVRRTDQPGSGGVTVVMRRTQPLEGAAVERVVLTAAPDDHFEVVGLPVGTYDTWGLADGYVTQGPRQVVIRPGAASVFDADLARRVYRLDVPAESQRSPVIATLSGDADLTHARVWLDTPAPPANLAYTPLPADGRVALPVPTQGAHVVRAQLATLAHAQGGAGDPGNGFLAAVTPVLSAPFVLDGTAPEVLLARIGTGAAWVDGVDVDLTVTCVDGLHDADALSLSVVGDDGTSSEGGFRPLVPLRLAAVDGAKTLSITCADPAGNTSAAVLLDVILDRVPPVLAAGSFTLNGGRPNEPTRNRIVTVRYGLSDALSGLDGVALSAVNPDCAAVAYAPVGAGTTEFLLSDAQGARSLFLCGRDRAGNRVGPVQSGNAVVLDTLAPAAGALTLAGGVEYTRAAAVSRVFANLEPNTRVRLSGDLAPNQAGPFTPALVPDPLVLTGTQGLKSVTAVLVDDAGNESPGFSDVVTLDAVPPLNGVVVLADGATVVNTRTIPVTVSGTDADTMLVYEVGANAACGDPACGDPRFLPLSSASTLTLSDGLGAKRVCWKFCDLAGNGSAVGQSTPNLTLGNYVSRPTPVIDAVVPQSVVALSADVSAPITLVGRGIAANTQAQVGEFLLPCVSAGADACQPDVPGGCGLGGRCEATCAERCDLTLPAQLSRRAGTYVVRLVTPAPVVDGLDTSVDVAFLDVVAPQPRLIGVSRSGVIQDLVDGMPRAQIVALDVVGQDCTDNVAFRLGPNFGRVRSFTRDAANPRLATFRVEVSTENLYPSDLEDAEFTAENPSPGGGASPRLRFGIDPRATGCPNDDVCVSNLRRTRDALPSGRARAQTFTPGAAGDAGALRWLGGTAAGFRGAGGSIAGRIPGTASGGLIPRPWPARGDVRLEDSLGTGPAVALEPALRRNDATFGAELGSPATAFESLLSGDLDQDGVPDLILFHRLETRASVHIGDGDGHFHEVGGWALHANGPGFYYRGALADFDGDGALDVVVNDGTVLSGGGDGTFRERWFFPGHESVRVGDLNRDGAPDLIFGGNWSVQRRDVSVRLGVGDGSFREPQSFLPAGNLSIDGPAHVADLSGDGLPDLIVRIPGADMLSLGNGDGTFQPGVALPLPLNAPTRIVADLDGDGALDLLASEISDGGATVLLGRGDGTFVAAGAALALPPGTLHGPADFDGDGRWDFALTTQRAGTTLYLGNGDGTFAPGATLVTGGQQVTNTLLGDFDADGAVDLLTDTYPVALRVRLGGGREGALGRVTTLAANFPTHVQIRDLDGDGRNDLLYSSNFALFVRSGTAGGTLAPETFVPMAAAQAFTFGRLNGDARPDLVMLSAIDGSVAVRLQNVDGTFAAPVSYPMNGGGNVLLGDLDANGRDDVVLLGSGGGLDVRLANADGTLRNRVTYPTPPSTFALGDLDGDGDLDVMLAGGFLRNGGDGTFGAVVDSAVAANSLGLTDLNADGRLDVVACWGGNVGLLVYLNTGNAVFQERQRDATGCSGVTIVDLNGDGAPDVATGSGDNPTSLRVYMNDGAGRLSAPADLRIGRSLMEVAAGDLNGDRVPDLAVNHLGTNQVTLWETPTASPWTQELTDLPAPRNPVAGAETRFTTHQAMQFIDELAVRVRLEGASLQNLRVRLRAPDGTEIALDNGAAWANRAVWQGHYTGASVPLLATLHGWQPEGDWTLIVQGGNAAQAVLTDFAVITHGWFTRAAP